ncbi:hypothetical protein GGF31_004468 [Allomyces arbusculus]|nr:hypothetical protein GGF31_004468 [Allomyces arbusculus]
MSAQAEQDAMEDAKCKVVVRNLTQATRFVHMREIFGYFGLVTNVELLSTPQRNGAHGTTMCVTYPSSSAASDAIAHMDGGEIDGAVIECAPYPLPRRRSSIQARRPRSPNPPMGLRHRLKSPPGQGWSRRMSTSRSPPRRRRSMLRSPPLPSAESSNVHLTVPSAESSHVDVAVFATQSPPIAVAVAFASTESPHVALAVAVPAAWSLVPIAVPVPVAIAVAGTTRARTCSPAAREVSVASGPVAVPVAIPVAQSVVLSAARQVAVPVPVVLAAREVAVTESVVFASREIAVAVVLPAREVPVTVAAPF